MGDLEISSVKACLSLLSIKNSEHISPEFAIQQLGNTKAELQKLKLQIIQLAEQVDESISMWNQLQKKQGGIVSPTQITISSTTEKPDLVPLPKKAHFLAI